MQRVARVCQRQLSLILVLFIGFGVIDVNRSCSIRISQEQRNFVSPNGWIIPFDDTSADDFW